MANEIEILAPAGNLDILKTAIDSGADAVYFGGTEFSARSNATNFEREQIAEAVEYAHLRNAKVYVAVNTIISDLEFRAVYDFVRYCYLSNVDAVIVQDLGVAKMIKTHFPDFPMHASTQMSVYNLDGVLIAKKMGFKRVVLARELSFDEIKYISDNCDVELEVFVHGALCMSYSGQCLFSSFLGGRSGNKGSCAQPCRLPYTLFDSEFKKISESEKYLLSLKDLCLIDYVSKLKNIGVSSLKIEGRMKSDAYVSAVSGIYNKYRDNTKIETQDKELLKNIFSRNGFTDGHFNSNHGRDMLSYSKNHDNIYSSVTNEVLQKALSYAHPEKKYHIIDAEFEMKLNQFAILKVTFDNAEYVVESKVPAQRAVKSSTDNERIREQLCKLGGTLFDMNSLVINADENLFFPIKEINEMRRSVLSKIEMHLKRNVRTDRSKEYANNFDMFKNTSKLSAVKPLLTASVMTKSQADTAYELGFGKIYIPYDVYISDKDRFDAEGDVFSVKLPPIMHDSSDFDISSIKTESICIQNVGQLLYSGNHKIHADYRMNVFNSMSIYQLKHLGISSCTLSVEANISQMKEIAKLIPTEIVVYGKVSIMTIKNCVYKSATGKCKCESGNIFYLKDRKDEYFPLFTDCKSCTNVIYNCIPIVMSDKSELLKSINADMHRFDFTTESEQEIRDIVEIYEKRREYPNRFTRGHFFNGIQ